MFLLHELQIFMHSSYLIDLSNQSVLVLYSFVFFLNVRSLSSRLVSLLAIG